MRFFSVLVAFVLISFGAVAQQKWTLRQCIDHAIENNIEIKQMELQVEDSELTLNTNQHSRLPDLNAGINQGFSFGQSTVRVADPADPDKYVDMLQDTRTSNTSLSLSSGMTLFSGRRITNQIKSSKLNLMAATENLNKAKENLELRVVSLYLDVLFRKEIKEVYQNETDLTSTQVERTRILLDNGRVPKSQLYEIQAQLAQNESRLTNANNEVQLSLLNLAQSLNIEDHYSFDILEPFTDDVFLDNTRMMYSPREIYDIALGIKPQIREAKHRLEVSEYALKVEKAGFWPTLSLSMGYNNGFHHVFGQDNESISSQLKKRQNQSIGLNLRIPIFNKNATRNRVRSARIAIKDRELALDNVKLVVYKEIQQAHQSVTSAQARYHSAKKALDAAAESFDYIQERYDVGKATPYELNESQTKLLSAKSEQLQSKYDYIFKNKILDFYRGESIDIEY